MKTLNQHLKGIHAFETKVAKRRYHNGIATTLRLHNRKAGTFKANESRYIALLAISKSIKKVYSIACANI